MTRNSHEKLARDVEVELAHQLDVFDKLGRDLRQVDFVNVHLLLFHQVKEQVERAFEDLELDFVFRHGFGRRTRLNGERILTSNTALAMTERDDNPLRTGTVHGPKNRQLMCRHPGNRRTFSLTSYPLTL